MNSRVYYCYKYFYFKINTVLFNFVHRKNHENSITVYKKNIKQHKVSDIDNKSAYWYDFWRSCDTEDWSNDAENTALITEINYTLKLPLF